MGDPDWDRYLVTSGKKGAPLGDPTRWGAVIRQPVTAAAGLQTLASEQVLQVACADRFPRAWTLIGTLEAPNDYWIAPPDGTTPGDLLSWYALCRIRMGVAQNTIVHSINLRVTIDTQAPFYTPTSYGGESYLVTGPTTVFPFVIDNAIVANNISIQIIHLLDYGVAPAAGLALTTALQVTPYAAGTGL